MQCMSVGGRFHPSQSGQGSALTRPIARPQSRPQGATDSDVVSSLYGAIEAMYVRSMKS